MNEAMAQEMFLKQNIKESPWNLLNLQECSSTFSNPLDHSIIL